MSRLILMRHALATKNEEQRSGGAGSPLTQAGYAQLGEVVPRLGERGLRPSRIYSAPVVQARETSAWLGEALAVPVEEHPDLRPLFLGVLDGLSHKDARSRHPAIARRMELWREGRLEIHELVIPQAEDYHEFWRRGERFVDGLDDEGDVLVVGTRSILILLISVVLARTIGPGGGYRDIPIDCCSFLTFRNDGRRYAFAPELSDARFAGLPLR
jgi:broad specificity phosphatase PhoE